MSFVKSSVVFALCVLAAVLFEIPSIAAVSSEFMPDSTKEGTLTPSGEKSSPSVGLAPNRQRRSSQSKRHSRQQAGTVAPAGTGWSSVKPESMAKLDPLEWVRSESVLRLSVVGVPMLTTAYIKQEFGAGNVTSTKANSGTGLSLGAGVLAETAQFNRWSAETGLLYVTRSIANGTFTSMASALQVPLLARYDVISDLVSVGLGGYYAYGIGQVGTDGQDGVTRYVGYDTAGIHRIDYGIVASVGGSYPVADEVDIMADVRYNYGLARESTSGVYDPSLGTGNSNLYFRMVQALVGFRFFL